MPPQNRKEFLERLGRDPTNPYQDYGPPPSMGGEEASNDYRNFGIGVTPHPTTGIPTYPMYAQGFQAGADFNAIPRGSAVINSALQPPTGPAGLVNPYPYVPPGRMPPPSPEPLNLLLIRGNVDPYHRRTLYNPDGSVSTTSSWSKKDEDRRSPNYGKEVLVPTVVNGIRLTNDQAWDRYRRTGQHFGVFANGQDADRYAWWLHWEQVRRAGGSY